MHQKKTSAISRFASKFFTVQNVLLALGWLVWLALLIYVQSQTADLAPFDPYEILKVSSAAAECTANCRFDACILISTALSTTCI